jgi:hypothetical protein
MEEGWRRVDLIVFTLILLACLGIAYVLWRILMDAAEA